MPAYGYEFYLLVVNSIVDHSKIKFISTRGHVISSIYVIFELNYKTSHANSLAQFSACMDFL